MLITEHAVIQYMLELYSLVTTLTSHRQLKVRIFPEYLLISLISLVLMYVFLADVHLQPASGCYRSFCSHKSLICPNIVVFVKCRKKF